MTTNPDIFTFTVGVGTEPTSPAVQPSVAGILVDRIPPEDRDSDVPIDQRGNIRPQGTRCDVGVFELRQGPVPPTTPPTPTSTPPPASPGTPPAGTRPAQALPGRATCTG